MRRTALTLVSLAVATAPLALTPGTAAGAAAERPRVVAGGLLSPLSLDVTPKGAVWFSQNFSGALMRARPGKPARVVHQAAKGTEVGAVSFHRGVTTFAVTTSKGRTALMTRSRSGKVEQVANLFAHESKDNPDGAYTYGFTDLDPECEDRLPRFLKPYEGIVESHPYASVTRGRSTYVADAAGNTILAVSRDGAVETVAALPPQPATITAEAAEANGLPDCVVGHDYHFEAVPTDVEKGSDGMLYVTTLPGGPEDPSLGARGAIHRVDPATGDVETLVRRLLSPTGLAIADNGDMYVAQLFRNRISRVEAGTTTARRWRAATLPGDVDVEGGRVWATRKVLTGLSGEEGDRPRGQVVRYPG